MSIVKNSDLSGYKIILISCLFFYLPGLMNHALYAQEKSDPRMQLDFKNGVRVELQEKLTRGLVDKFIEIDEKVVNTFPRAKYELDTNRIGYIAPGELVPDEILDMPLIVAHGFRLRDTVTLRQFSEFNYIVLDFWAKWCAPCIASMQKWEEREPEIRGKIAVLGVHLDFDHKALDEMRERKWHHPQVVGEAAWILSRYFCQDFRMVGPSAWIHKGRFMGLSRAGKLEGDFVGQLLRGEIDSIPEYAVSEALWSSTPSKRLLLDIDNAVRRIPQEEQMISLRKSRQEEIRKNYRNYPMTTVHIDTNRIGYISPGATIPDEIMDLPLLAVERLKGRDTITLRQYADKQFLVLDFWAKWCSPCIKSMQKWEDLREDMQPHMQILGINVGNDVDAIEQMKLRGWRSMQVIGESAWILNRYFCREPGVVGPSAWIKDGRFLGLSISNKITKTIVEEMISQNMESLPDSIRQAY